MNNVKILEEIQKDINNDNALKGLEKLANYTDENGPIDFQDIKKIIFPLFESDNKFVRIKLTEIAQSYKSNEILLKLIKLMKEDEDYFVRGFAAKTLGMLGNISAKPALQEALNDDEKFVTEFAQKSLEKLTTKVSFNNKIASLRAKMQEKKKMSKND
ncbi:MAG: HEAT repeat domain-containing protein [Fusobacteriota bacterium]